MPEPRIGMKYSSYNKMMREISKECPWTTSNGDIPSKGQRRFYHHERGFTFATEDFTIAKSDNGDVFIQSTLNIHGFKYDGKAIWNNEDIKNGKKLDMPYTKIYGEKTYAFDLNGNGKVDKNEIFYYNDVSKKPDDNNTKSTLQWP